MTGPNGTYAFVYDAGNRLIHSTGPAGTSNYSYDGLGLRVAEYDSGTGQHDLMNDGFALASPLLVDHNLSAKTLTHVFTPGLDRSSAPFRSAREETSPREGVSREKRTSPRPNFRKEGNKKAPPGLAAGPLI